MADSTEPLNGRALWRDRGAQVTLGLAVVLNILLFLLVILTNDRLAESIANSGTKLGSVDRFGPPSSAIILPVIGLITWLLAGALGFFYYAVRDEASIAYTVWGASALVVLATWVPVLGLIFDV